MYDSSQLFRTQLKHEVIVLAFFVFACFPNELIKSHNAFLLLHNHHCLNNLANTLTVWLASIVPKKKGANGREPSRGVRVKD